MTMPELDPNGRYYCDFCKDRYNAPGDCPCGEEPLMDLHDEEVQALLEGQDSAALAQRAGIFTAVSVIVCSPMLLLGCLGIKALFAAVPLYCLCVVGMAGLLTLVFRPAKKAPRDPLRAAL